MNTLFFKTKLKSIFSFLILSMTLGCSTMIDVDIDYRPQLVVNSLFSPDSVWNVTLLKSASVLVRNYGTLVGNAQVSIYDSKKALVEELTLYFGKISGYRGKTKPVAGEQYTIEAKVEGNETVVATGQIPASAVAITDVEVDSSKFKSGAGDLELKVTFRDPEAEKNFYEIKVLGDFYYYVNTKATRYTQEIYVEPVDPALGNDEANGLGKIFNDNLFNGKEYTFRMKVRPPGYDNTGQYKVVLLSVSKEYYQYFTTRSLQNTTAGDPFAQPTQVFNNVSNGLGIFAGYSTSVFKLN